MKKSITIFILILCTLNIHAQDEIENETEALIKLDQYQKIINKYGSKIDPDYSYQILYNIGLSYYMLNDNKNCVKVMDLALLKDSEKSAPYFIKGATFNYMNKFEDAIPLLQKAINLESDSSKLAHSYRHLGFSYYYLNNIDLSIKSYQNAILYEKENPLPYIMIAQLYNSQNNNEKALEYYYLGKQNSSSLYEEYTSILFNIGLFEQKQGNYKKAESAYKALIETDPKDYHTYAKLIQIYNQKKEYDKVYPLKAILYDAHKRNLIEDENLSDMFCIDQFKVNEIFIKAFERYEEGDKDYIYNKILFYIADNESNIEYRIQTEYSPAAVSNKVGKYILCANKDNNHINYGIIFKDNTSYEAIKNIVISILKREE